MGLIIIFWMTSLAGASLRSTDRSRLQPVQNVLTSTSVIFALTAPLPMRQPDHRPAVLAGYVHRGSGLFPGRAPAAVWSSRQVGWVDPEQTLVIGDGANRDDLVNRRTTGGRPPIDQHSARSALFIGLTSIVD